MLALLIAFNCPSPQTAIAEELGLQAIRRSNLDQPHTFENEILFAERRGEIVRSDRFVGSADHLGDFDGDVDFFDYYAAQICLSFSGPEFVVPAACLVFDYNDDGDVDLEDIAAFLEDFTCQERHAIFVARPYVYGHAGRFCVIHGVKAPAPFNRSINRRMSVPDVTPLRSISVA